MSMEEGAPDIRPVSQSLDLAGADLDAARQLAEFHRLLAA